MARNRRAVAEPRPPACVSGPSGDDLAVSRFNQRVELLDDLVLAELVVTRAETVLAATTDLPRLHVVTGGEGVVLGVQALADNEVQLGPAGQQVLRLVVVRGAGLRVVDVPDLERLELGVALDGQLDGRAEAVRG